VEQISIMTELTEAKSVPRPAWNVAEQITYIKEERNKEMVPQSLWNAHLAMTSTVDFITVRNLQVTVNAGVDVWGRQKKQRALVSVSLSLASPFQSAASEDKLDSSTVHYGILSKNIREVLERQDADWTSTAKLAEKIAVNALETAKPTELRAVDVDVFYPKGSMLGDGAGLRYCPNWVGPGALSRVLYLRNVRVPCLVGVNANERTRKQPVVVNMWLECLPQDLSDKYPELEAIVVEVRSS
jgi:FolB domain-containing protein